MRKSVPLLLRLISFPAAAAMTVTVVAWVSLMDLGEKPNVEEPKAEDAEELQVLRRPAREGTVPQSAEVPELTENEALKGLEERPGRAAILKLWSIPNHRERLFQLLLSKTTPQEVRLWLLGRFEAEERGRALEAARAIVKAKEMPQEALLYSALEIVARYGEASDVALLGEREFELHQTKAFRESQRDALCKRVGRGN